MPRGIYDSPLRGLASASSQTKKRVAALGGLVCSIKHGDLFCEARAERGGQAFVEKYGNFAVGRSKIIRKVLKELKANGSAS